MKYRLVEVSLETRNIFILEKRRFFFFWVRVPGFNTSTFESGIEAAKFQMIINKNRGNKNHRIQEINLSD